jgi:hypothetical protein
VDLELSDVERWGAEQNRALARDLDGNEVFVGLNREESLFFVGYRRMTSLPLRAAGLRPSQADRKRASELRQKHEIARLQVIGAMVEKENFGPTSH